MLVKHKYINESNANRLDRFAYRFKKLYSRYLIFLSLIFWLITFSGCKKWLEVPPSPGSITSANAFSTNAAAIAAVTGIYTQLSLNDETQSYGSSGNFTDIPVCTALSADELTLYDTSDPTYSPFYVNALATNTQGGGFWSASYLQTTLYAVNAAIEGLDTAKRLSPAVKQQLLGEAYFMRAYFYFYLTNLYGEVPLALTTNSMVNASLARSPVKQVYQQIIDDLTQARGLLSENFLDGTLLNVTSQRVRPTKWAAEALLAKVYLYNANVTGDASNYAKADSAATVVINNSTLFSLAPLNSVFLANSNEAIWQLQPVGTGPQSNTGEGAIFVLPATGPNTAGNYPVYLSRDLVNSFEPNDQRKVDWVDSVTVDTTTYDYAYKYKIGAVSVSTQEYIMMLRLGEQYLIRAEAEARQANVGASQSDLNVVRNRAGLPNTTANSSSTLLTALLQERRVELFTEWGNRWFDLRRFGVIDSVMNIVAPQKGGTWSSYKELYPVPLYDIQVDNKLTQNPGY